MKVSHLAWIQTKSQFLFHKNLPPRDFSIMTLFLTLPKLLHSHFQPQKKNPEGTQRQDPCPRANNGFFTQRWESDASYLQYIWGQLALWTWFLLCWTGANWFMGRLGNLHSTLNFCPDGTSQEGIKCTKTNKYLRPYSLIFRLCSYWLLPMY